MTVDQSRRAHPDVIADDRARQRRGVPDPADHTAVWAGRARMAAARQAAGQPLDHIDRQALTLARQENTTP